MTLHWPHKLSAMQWEIYDAYIADQEKQRVQEEINKQKAAAKKASTAVETAETSQDPAKACLALLHPARTACSQRYSQKRLSLACICQQQASACVTRAEGHVGVSSRVPAWCCSHQVCDIEPCPFAAVFSL